MHEIVALWSFTSLWVLDKEGFGFHQSRLAQSGVGKDPVTGCPHSTE